MSITAGNLCKVELTGTAVSFVGEAVSTSDNLTYQITDTDKQVLDQTETISVHLRSVTGDTTESGTNTTNVTIAGHGLSTGDLVVNTTRSNAKRIITVVDVNNFTVATVTSQTSGDSMDLYPTEASSGYTLNRLFAKAVYGSSTSRTILISGSYLPLVEATQAKETEINLSANNEDVSVFGNTWVNKAQRLKDETVSISNFYLDNTNVEYLIDNEIKVYSFYTDRSSTPHLKAWVIPESVGDSSSVDGSVEESLEFAGVVDADGRSFSLDD